MSGGMLKKIRIFILLYILFMVAVAGWLAKARSTDWDKPLNVVIYAINGDDSAASKKYIDKIGKTHFDAIESFFEREARHYNLSLSKPVDVTFVGELESKPPLPPRHGSTLSIMLWSLKLRYWAWKNDQYPYAEDVQIFVLYFDPEEASILAHSLGLQKGLIGVVNAFASKEMKTTNHVIIAHELLHTVGATDKYDPASNMPIYPTGYANPKQEPLFPQKQAEIMAGRVAISETRAEQPTTFKQVMLGNVTAAEINWLK